MKIKKKMFIEVPKPKVRAPRFPKRGGFHSEVKGAKIYNRRKVKKACNEE